LDALELILKEVALPVSAIGTGQAYGEEGLSFTHPESSVREKAIQRIKAQVRFAAGLNAVVIVGLMRGKIEEGVTEDQADEWMSSALIECTKENSAVKIAIEPINRYETDLLNTVEATLGFVNKLALDNIGLLLDTFHMNIEEPSMFQSIEAAKDRLFHFHVADSNRWHPGAGHIDFKQIVTQLDRIGYEGYLSAEIMPFPDPDTAALKTKEVLGPIIKR
jgi:sugar phosphate isomerase/epimerase